MCANVFVRKDGKILMLKRSPQKRFAPNYVHPIGGKIDLNENPYDGAERELMEESGIRVKNMRLEAVFMEITPNLKWGSSHNWLIFHFSGDYDSGELSKTDEGEFVWLDVNEVPRQDLFPSVQQEIGHILNPNDGTVFATFSYDEDWNIVKRHEGLCVV